MRYIGFLISAGLILLTGSACSKFLNEKPLSSLAVLETLDDYKAVIQNETNMNRTYPFCADYASDYFYLNEADYNALNETGRASYSWNELPPHANNWNQSYARIYNTNVVLDGIDDAQLGNWPERERQVVKGMAYFFKAFSMVHLAITFSPAYDADDVDNALGLPLRNTSDINERVPRSTVGETYSYTESLLLKALPLLPLTAKEKTLPSREAGFALLARLYLLMGEYDNAAIYADSCLQINRALIDYSTLDTSSVSTQFPELNAEVILHAEKTDVSAVMRTNKARVDSDLYDSYTSGDLRKELYFRRDTSGMIGFFGDYGGNTVASTFAGIARDEIYLVLSESLFRLGNMQRGTAVLNELLINRFDSREWKPLQFTDQETAIDVVLEERKKELAFRAGLRWSDLKRLNLDPSRQVILYRQMGDQVFELPPGGDRYLFKIPDAVVALGGIAQNP